MSSKIPPTSPTQRRDRFGFGNVDFRHDDARTFLDEKPFDAVVCRLLLMHLPDAIDVLAHHLRNLHAGGVFIAIDYDVAGMRALPQVELYSRLIKWIIAGFEYAHGDAFVGVRFPVLFEQAGFRDIGTLGLQSYSPPRSPHVVAYLVAAVRAMKDAIVNCGVTTEEELGLDTLEQRLGAAFMSANAVFSLPTMVGGWDGDPSKCICGGCSPVPGTACPVTVCLPGTARQRVDLLAPDQKAGTPPP